MKLEPNMFPYPVLNEEMDDYINNKAFRIEIKEEQITNQVFFHITFFIEDEEIRSRINKGEFAFAFHIEGNGAVYRRFFCLNGRDKLSFSIKSEEARKQYFAYGLIVSNETLYFIKNKNFNTLYYGKDYSIHKLSKGEIVAFTPKIIIDLELDEKKLSDNIFRIRKGADSDKLMKVELGYEDHIVIILPVDLYNLYNQLNTNNDNNKMLINNLIFLPALTYIIDSIRQKEFTRSETKWLESFYKQIPEDQIISTAKTSIELAQEALELPYKAISNYFKVKDIEDYE